MSALLYPEGFISTTLTTDINASTTVIPLDDLPVRVTSGYLVIEPLSSTKREVVFFTSVGASSVTAADDTTDGNDATGRGCLGSITVGANTTHAQGVSVIIASVEQYWKRLYDVFTEAHNADGTHKSGSVLTLPQINDTTADHQYVFAVSELAADRTVTLPLLTGNDEFVFKDHTQTLTNKTLTSPVVGGSGGTGAGIMGFNGTTKQLLIGDGAVNEPVAVGPWIAYTPTVSNITVGNGTLDFAYANIGKTVKVRGRFTFGTGSSISGLPTFSLPFAFNSSNNRLLTIFRIVDSGTGEFAGIAEFSGTADVVIKVLNCASTYGVFTDVSSTVPMTWANGDYFQFEISYEAAA